MWSHKDALFFFFRNLKHYKNYQKQYDYLE